MKILDIPQSGKRGVNVSQQGRNGQISRALALVSNPRTPAQMRIRTTFQTVVSRWRTLATAAQLVWNAAAAGYQSVSRCGTSGPLTGQQLHAKINCTNLLYGAELVDVPPDKPAFGALAVTNLVAANAADVITLKLTCPADPGATTFLRAAPPESNGRFSIPEMRVLGPVPAAVLGVSDITGLYSATFGTPKVNQKIFVAVNQVIAGHESIPATFWAVVPAAA